MLLSSGGRGSVRIAVEERRSAFPAGTHAATVHAKSTAKAVDRRIVISTSLLPQVSTTRAANSSTHTIRRW
jgi:hypothetical protein